MPSTQRDDSVAQLLRSIPPHTIATVFDDFLAGEQATATSEAFETTECVIGSFRSCLDSYGYLELDAQDCRIFDRLYNAGARDRRDFCEIFEADHILDSVDEFLTHYVVGKVITTDDVIAATGNVIARLAWFLRERGQIHISDAQHMRALGHRAIHVLPQGIALARGLRDLADSSPDGARESFREDGFRITRVRPGKIWMEADFDGEKVGPFLISEEISGLCVVGWIVAATIARVDRAWRFLEVGPVYPKLSGCSLIGGARSTD